jgi:hypothetical protein
MENVSKLVAQLAQASGAEVAYKSDQGCIEVFGTERAVRNVYQMLYDMPFLKVSICYNRLTRSCITHLFCV